MQTYISIEEFNDFKIMMEEKIAKSEQKSYDLAEILVSGFDRMDQKFIHADEKMENLTEMMIDGFDMVYDKLEG